MDISKIWISGLRWSKLEIVLHTRMRKKMQNFFIKIFYPINLTLSNTMNYSPLSSLDNRILWQIKYTIYQRLDPQKYRLFLFGSRAIGEARVNSDYDIGILWDERVNFNTLMLIKSDLEDIPAVIDIVDFKMTQESFRKIALKNIISDLP